MKKVIKVFFCLLLLSFALPSGTLFNIPVKTILSLILIPLIVLYDRQSLSNRANTILIFSLVSLISWIFLSVGSGFINSSLSFLKNFLSLMTIFWVAYQIPKIGVLSHQGIIKILSFVSIFIIFFKIVTSLSLTFGFLTIESAANLFLRFFNTELTTMEMPLGPVLFYRVMLSNDQIPIVWFSFFIFSQSSYFKKILVTLLVLLFTFVVYSRVVIVEVLILLITALILHLRERRMTGKKDGKKIAFFVITFTVLTIILLTNKKIDLIGAVSLRFTSYSTEVSDNIRDEQFLYLWEGFNERPILGHGAGSYVREYIRSESLPFSYELEYLSFLYQFGIVGFILIISPIIVLFYAICLKNIKNNNIRILVVLNLIIWLVRPFFNPSFLSSNSGIIIITIHSYSLLLDYEKEKNLMQNEIKTAHRVLL